ncbi:hypothetical protein LTR66_017686 [Elasticomyces elasticus]|nr:hypothetical protein LTR66_017686 [Elasticomyces elasticus]
MPSSSLFLRSSTTLVSALSVFFSLVSAGSSSYSNVQSYNAQNFFDGFDFFTDSDPTHGFVQYVSRDTANNLGIIGTDPNSAYMGVDSSSILDPTKGPGRASVRLQSKNSWTKGLFVLDVPHMPASVCGTWPAFWTLSTLTPWPNYGEIDILEGVSNHPQNLASLHDNGATTGVSTISGDARTFSGLLQTSDCNYHSTSSSTNPTGCGILDQNPNSFGDGFNSQGGAYVAMEWTDDQINVWLFNHGTEPSDITSASPDPSQWPKPSQSFGGPDVNIKDNFKQHQIIFDTTFW